MHLKLKLNPLALRFRLQLQNLSLPIIVSYVHLSYLPLHIHFIIRSLLVVVLEQGVYPGSLKELLLLPEGRVVLPRIKIHQPLLHFQLTLLLLGHGS